MKKKTVFVGISGGVDSAVSAALLKEQGYVVIGVFIRTWHPDFLECNEEEERLDAMRVAAHLDIPFLTFDLSDVYKKEVADYMISEYKAGKTPNPDVMCNKEVKFGAFLKKAISMGADYVATGHYAQNFFMKNSGKKASLMFFSQSGRGSGPRGTEDLIKNIEGTFLFKGVDTSKDQSYFLWTLKQNQLNRILFPIGHLKKTEVRKFAKKFNLPVAEKKDSQGICFLGAVDLKDFLKHYIKEKKGKVLNQDGEEIGYHDGVVFHTLGERHGFVITKKGSKDGAYYVIDKDLKKNILYVSQDKNFQRSALKSSKRADLKNLEIFYFKIKDINWISEIPKEDKDYTAQIRYHGEFLDCKIKYEKSDITQIIFKKPVLVASGQSCVIYDKDICLGGGVVL
ncbi:MAG: tRNA-specific 2-thiouridylase MnmA [Candidatus Nomurabacteria bacterium GW2011_GWE1_32_28]|uniref:tRNA-specific 2-thiouridylase MnmA n=1 Tax=Candidatus Nomurabacteria bacterium GW2011_GWF1_31_48 TaxID=1618767 RepID=A0A0F9YW39_9BACT|nr:MAG: tRNA-specific 2-thiouridylase MnmA [Candidatus Nomurabacteria bacterium GW2011_GWF2_30_133]KKP28918.1 MAG: tRNA-specific 2-thiouridylase MnmA [Candidatus Nomurabacteria bacterium GW2011_GWE2_31_40]KKP30656.1 MAG: tRNA-specific 2-thiouridylase MnmA [Candidatus Nomurabacteria bacterium GW2011_GWF1_31_48]KKP35174.1 MAG: tRNA-specific 2-thiouridylase MnmA [Candidatus Nomurabacteria bacterium GW2011_GWE1_32_28]HAS80483.1 tRNA 2-thiouridine(34) synthase MnmA [Candidatus Nomurabacteria bacteri